MKKIMLLIPCLMLDTNRKVNHEAMEYAKRNYPVDEIVVYDQEFQETDYRKGFTYIGHQTKRQGFVTPRNELLKYFYNSDYDYAMWVDANEKITQSSLNDVQTLLTAIRYEEVQTNVVLTTLGIIISQERQIAKARKDYFSKVHLLRCKKGYNWMHGLIMKNFKKTQNQEVYIDERCDPWKGTSEDVYFVRLLFRLTNVHLCPTITVSKPPSKTSTWMTNEKGYNYPPLDYAVIDDYIKENASKYIGFEREKIEDVVSMNRIKNDTIAYLREYRPRGKKGKTK